MLINIKYLLISLFLLSCRSATHETILVQEKQILEPVQNHKDNDSSILDISQSLENEQEFKYDSTNLEEYINTIISGLSSNKRLKHHSLSFDINYQENPVFKTYISTMNGAIIRTSPDYCSSLLSDSIQIFDSIQVPFFDGKPFEVNMPCEACSDLQTLCFYKGELGFFRNNTFIDSKKVYAHKNNQYRILIGSNLVIVNNTDESYFEIERTFPKNIHWSSDSSKILYTTREYSGKPDHYHYSKVYFFDLVKWENKYISIGLSPQYFELNSLILCYAYELGSQSDLKILSYDLNSNEKKIHMEIPDSLDAGCNPGELTYYADFQSEIINDQTLYYAILWKGHCEAPNNKKYKLSFSLDSKEVRYDHVP